MRVKFSNSKTAKIYKFLIFTAAAVFTVHQSISAWTIMTSQTICYKKIALKDLLNKKILFVTCKNETNKYLNELPTNGSSILVTIGATKVVPLRNEIENRLIES